MTRPGEGTDLRLPGLFDYSCGLSQGARFHFESPCFP